MGGQGDRRGTSSPPGDRWVRFASTADLAAYGRRRTRRALTLWRPRWRVLSQPTSHPWVDPGPVGDQLHTTIALRSRVGTLSGQVGRAIRVPHRRRPAISSASSPHVHRRGSGHKKNLTGSSSPRRDRRAAAICLQTRTVDDHRGAFHPPMNTGSLRHFPRGSDLVGSRSLSGAAPCAAPEQARHTGRDQRSTNATPTAILHTPRSTAYTVHPVGVEVGPDGSQAKVRARFSTVPEIGLPHKTGARCTSRTPSAPDDAMFWAPDAVPRITLTRRNSG